MTSEAAIHQRNLQSNILFMQQQHADTLKSLHGEISKLQKKCSDSTFQLTMQMPDLEKEENARLRKQHKEQLDKQQILRDEFLESKRKRDKKIKLLEHQLKTHEKRYIEDLRQKDVVLNQLRSEVESKSSHIAYLTTELHKIKIKQPRRGSGNSVSSSESGGSARYDPSPPKHGGPKLRGVPRLNNDSVSTSKCSKSHMFNHSNIIRASVRGSDTRTCKIPDPSPFLMRRDSIDSVGSDVRLNMANPLPPISKEILDDITTPDYDIVFHTSCAPQSVKAISSTETLAVDQLSTTGLSWQPAPHGSKSSESH